MVTKTAETQYTLFDDPQNLPRYDKGAVRHVVADMIRFGADPANEAPDLGGTGVTLEERAATMERAAKMYADYNRLTVGLGKAVRMPDVLRELEERYGEGNVPRVVAGARNNSFYTPAGSELNFANPPLELRVLNGVLKWRELLDAGVNPNTLNAELQPLIVGIRHEIGIKDHGIDAKKRNAAVKKVRTTANRAKEYGR